jgi:flagellar biosynthesis GTPase FlhF
VLKTAPVDNVPTGRYYFKSKPRENAHQYRFASPLAEHVVSSSKALDTPTDELIFSLQASERASTVAKSLAGMSGEMMVKQVTFRMTAKDQEITESYILSGALTDDGRWLDEEYVADILELACVESRAGETIDGGRFESKLKARQSDLEQEVQGRNSRHYNQQEELLYRNQQDRKAEHEGKIREYRTKEKEARRMAKQADNPMEELKHKKEARKWEQRAEEADEEFREAKKRLRDEADQYLKLIEHSLKGAQEVEHLFSIRWRITA